MAFGAALGLSLDGIYGPLAALLLFGVELALLPLVAGAVSLRAAGVAMAPGDLCATQRMCLERTGEALPEPT